MGSEIYVLKRIPDLTLAQYSAEESGGVDEVIHQHSLFYRQLNRKGILFNEIYHLIYIYNPSSNPGSRLSIYFKVDGENVPICMDEFMTASPISPYFTFEKIERLNTDATKESDRDYQRRIREYEKFERYRKAVFSYRASVVKQDNMVMSSLIEKNNSFYTVNPWKANEKARLIGLFRMMQRLQKPIAYVVTLKAVDMSESLRESFRTQIQYIRTAEKSNIGNRDENAEQALRLYDKFLESLRSNPHFLCRISAYANDEALAKMVLDSAAAEAVEEGNYRIVSENGQFQPLSPEQILSEYCMKDAPRGMRKWNSLFLLKEAVCFSMLPVLYPGETIEFPKESAPIYERDGLYLGKDNSGYDVYFPLKLLPKHALLAGVPGSGKTYSMLHLSSQLAGKKLNIPILVLEPAKKEYRALAYNEDLPEITIFSPGGTGSFPLRINPFEFPIGYKLSEHITNLYQVFEGAFDLTPPLPIFVMDGIEEVYRDHGWYSFEVNDGKHSYPTTQELFDKIEAILESKKYEEDIKNNLITCLQTRIGSLLRREMGNVFNVSGSTISPEEWLNVSCVIELESLGTYAGNFLTLLLLTIIREMLKQNPKAPKDKPRHVIFLEEAHNLIGPTTIANSENGDTKVASTKYIVDMLAEVRALGEAIVIADQLPTALAPQVTKNTSLKLGHRITAMDDREMLASTMSADGVQLEKMGTFQPGHALCMYENIQKPFEIQICEYASRSESPSNEELLELLKTRKIYKKIMDRDFQILFQKFEERKLVINDKRNILLAGKHNILDNYETINNLDWQGDERTHALKMFEVKNMQYCRNYKQLSEIWLEHILEINEYAKMNLIQRSASQKYLSQTINEFINLLQEGILGFPDACETINTQLEPLQAKCLSKISEATKWIRG